MRVNAARERLERMLPEAGYVLEAFLNRKHKVKCPECAEWIEVKLPSQGALRAALAVYDRTGLGTQQTVHSKVERVQAAPEQLQGLVKDLLALPYPDRLLLSQAILPEREQVLELPASSLTSVDGESPADEPSSPADI